MCRNVMLFNGVVSIHTHPNYFWYSKKFWPPSIDDILNIRISVIIISFFLVDTLSQYVTTFTRTSSVGFVDWIWLHFIKFNLQSNHMAWLQDYIPSFVWCNEQRLVKHNMSEFLSSFRRPICTIKQPRLVLNLKLQN